jgi:hypothetical protein
MHVASATRVSAPKQLLPARGSVSSIADKATNEQDEFGSDDENLRVQVAKKRAVAASPDASSFHRQIVAARSDDDQLDALLGSIKGEDMLAELQGALVLCARTCGHRAHDSAVGGDCAVACKDICAQR